MAIFPPWHMLASMSRNAWRIAGHFQADVEALLHAQFALGVGDRLRADVDGHRGAKPPGKIEAIRVHVGDDDVAGAGVADDRRRHDPDRPGAGDQHVLAQDGKVQRRVDRVAEEGRRSTGCRAAASGRGPRRWSSAAKDTRRRPPAG